MGFPLIQRYIPAGCVAPAIFLRPPQHYQSVDMIIPFIKRFGKAAIAIELSAAAGLYYIFHEINTGGPETRKKWDERLPGLIDAFHKVTGDDRVIEHRRDNTSKVTETVRSNILLCRQTLKYPQKNHRGLRL
jgi:hypothetical protein